MITPKLDILPKPQRELWPALSELGTKFTLYGGTAIALQLGHRSSIGFDFFGMESFNPSEIYASFPFLKGARISQQQPNTLTCFVESSGSVKVSFFGLPKFRRVRPVVIARDNHLCIASLFDLAGTKAAVVQQRSEAKDYLDLDALVQAGVTLSTALSAARFIYGEAFNPGITLKALCYFEDGDLAILTPETRRRLVEAVAKVDLMKLPNLENESTTI